MRFVITRVSRSCVVVGVRHSLHQMIRLPQDFVRSVFTDFPESFLRHLVRALLGEVFG